MSDEEELKLIMQKLASKLDREEYQAWSKKLKEWCRRNPHLSGKPFDLNQFRKEG